MKLDERDIHIIKPLLEKEMKKIRKFAQKERQHFGNGFAFGELESYIELMLDDMDKWLENPAYKTAFEERMKRIGNPKAP